MYLLKVISPLGLHRSLTLYGILVIITEDFTVKSIFFFINNTYKILLYKQEKMRYLILYWWYN